MYAAVIAVGGALAMTVVLASVTMLARAVRGISPNQIPLVLTMDASFPVFCAAAGVFSALAAGYITTRAADVAIVRHAVASGALTMAGHGVVVAALGSPLSPVATVLYIGLTLPALLAGSCLASPAR
jgi:hypothetical protein